MSQGVLPYQYQGQTTKSGMTALGGLPVWLDLAQVAGLSASIGRHLQVRSGTQGWTDSQMVMSLILLQLAGGDCVDDLRVLEGDEGLGRLLRRVERHGLPRRERRELERRWRKDRVRAVPSPSAVFRYLSAFHDSSQEDFRVAGKAFIPVANEALSGLSRVNRDLLSFVQRRVPQREATLDMDATLVTTNKEEALYCYKKYKAYQPLNVYWAEAGVVAHTEFRDGNVPANHDLLRVFKESLDSMPAGVETVFLRSDTAGYDQRLLQYCAEGKHERFGEIGFAVGADVTSAFKQAVAEVPEGSWRPLCRERNGKPEDTDQEVAEVCFVPSLAGYSKKGPSYRFLAIRERFSVQLGLPDVGSQAVLPFQTLEMGGCPYKLFGIVTNRELPGEELIRWYRGRCGKSEEAHSVMKEDLAGGKLPSGNFGENAAWWWIMMLAFNLNAAMKRLVLGTEWVGKRLKAVRFALIHLPGRIVERARGLIVQVSGRHPSLGTLLRARSTIAEMALDPAV